MTQSNFLPKSWSNVDQFIKFLQHILSCTTVKVFLF